MESINKREARNKGKLFDQKLPLNPREIWAISIHLQNTHAVCHLAMFDLAIDSKLRGYDLASLRVRIDGADKSRRALSFGLREALDAAYPRPMMLWKSRSRPRVSEMLPSARTLST